MSRAAQGGAGTGEGVQGMQRPARQALLPLALGHLGVLGRWLSQAFMGPDLSLACPGWDHGSVTELWLLPPPLTELSVQ